MKKVLKGISVVILVISILLILTIVINNAIIIIRIMFFGLTVGSNEYPDSIWWGERVLYGISGIKTYFSVWGAVIIMIEIPIIAFCIIYQLIYFKIIRKKL